MLEYAYLFEKNGQQYYVYAESKVTAIAKYLEENSLSELPKGITITRSNA